MTAPVLFALTRTCPDCGGEGEVAMGMTRGARDEAPEPVAFELCHCNGGQVAVRCDCGEPAVAPRDDGHPLCVKHYAEDVEENAS